ncbi:MAG: hypothetical protein CMB47_00500 [Euryarchaeota archaeon]|nr:hypothetical protein [Euryarchaeota archaeon]
MSNNVRSRSSFLVFLMISSLLVSFIGPVSTVSASNETSVGTITGTETWSGLHQLTGDVTIATGAQLIINPGTTISASNGTHIDVRGSICIGEISCGASSNANPSQKITFQWSNPVNESATGDCLDLEQNGQKITVTDPSCYEGILIRSSIDLSLTGIRYLVMDGAYGVPHFIDAVNEWRYGALVIDGASPVITNIDFNDINTSSVLTTSLAQPTFIDSSFSVGNDDESGVGGSAMQIYASGSSVAPFTLDNPYFKDGTERGCEQNAGGRSAMWIQDSFVDIDNADIQFGDYGLSIRNSAGEISNSVISVTCTGVGIQGKRTVSSNSFPFDVLNNEITTDQGGPIVVTSQGLTNIISNEISGSSQGSGIVVVASQAEIHNNEIGPIGGWNGIWLRSTFDVVVENNSIAETNAEPIVAGSYYYSDTAISRLYLANNEISTDGTGTCSSNKWWGGEFACPAVMIFRTGTTIHDNDISAGAANGIMAIGSLLDVQRNTFDGASTGAVIKNYDDGALGSQQYGSLAFFAENTWLNVEKTYNITKSSVTVQSESIPSAPSGEHPVRLSWPDQEAWSYNNFQTSIVPPPIKNCPACDEILPRNFPLAISMDNNSTVFTFSNLTNLDTDNIFIETQPTHYAVQVSRAELVRLQALINGLKVSEALVLIEDALGNDLYSLITDENGYTPWFSLPSNFHLDFRGLGGGDNPDGFADDEYEDSCFDGIDNDGDLTLDMDDSDCDYSQGTRELSRYFYTIYKFDAGYKTGEFTLDESTYQDSIELENIAPTVSITQDDYHSYRNIVNITGSAHDGILSNAYATDELAQWSQRGYVHSVEVKNPFTSSWETASLAVDDSGADPAKVTRFNHPFKDWYYELDMSDKQEGNYLFEFRAFDGTDYSPVVSKLIKLNTEAPTILVTNPSSLSTHSDGTIHFEGYASDSYGCDIGECNKDIDKIYLLIEGPSIGDIDGDGEDDSFRMPVPVDASEMGEDGYWNWTWDFNSRPRESAEYTVTIWASDSDFCIGVIDVCQAYTLSLIVDNTNLAPIININQPVNGMRLSVSDSNLVSGVARDFDGDISRVEIEVKDIERDFMIVAEKTIIDFSENGEWNWTWDTTNLLRHDSSYLLRFRSYDGYDYSTWTSIEIIADNPPGKDNTQPIFSADGWIENIVLYCDTISKASNRCTTGEINLFDYFSDLEDNIEYISVFNNDDLPYDDNYGIVVKVSNSGIATYNPTDMNYYDTDISTWSLPNVIFEATDSLGSKINSNPVSFEVKPIQFVISEPDSNSVDDEGVVVYSGVGLPGQKVSVIINGNQINSTIVSSNSTWELGVPGSRISGSSVTPSFVMGGQDPVIVETIYKGTQEESGFPTGIVIGLVIVILLISAFGYFFVELETDEQPKTDIEVNKNFGLENQVETDSNKLEKHEDHPGWLWDPEKEEWIPDPDHSW